MREFSEEQSLVRKKSKKKEIETNTHEFSENLLNVAATWRVYIGPESVPPKSVLLDLDAPTRKIDASETVAEYHLYAIRADLLNEINE